MSTPRLTTTSYVVLGLVEQVEPATPYALKQFAQISVFNFWSIPHTQLYAECARLAREGLLDVEQEPSGRRRKTYRLTAAGSEALDAWRAEPTGELAELRDPGVLKLFFGSEPRALARAQIAAHEAKLAEFEATAALAMPDGMRRALEIGMGIEREAIRAWKALLGQRAGSPARADKAPTRIELV